MMPIHLLRQTLAFLDNQFIFITVVTYIRSFMSSANLKKSMAPSPIEEESSTNCPKASYETNSHTYIEARIFRVIFSTA